MDKILAAYGLHSASTITVIGNGLIHKTWKLHAGNHTFVLQRVNENVFREPLKIAENLRQLEAYIGSSDPAYLFVSPLPTVTNDRMYILDGSYYRLFSYVDNSTTYDAISSPDLAYEAAYQFGRFANAFAKFDSNALHATIPHFHDLAFREQQLKKAMTHGNSERKKRSHELILAARRYMGIVDEFRRIENDSLISRRVTHHDTKINNVLFTVEGKGITVIDLDTVMPGYFISDLGDMMRTYLSPANEEESDLTQIEVRTTFFEAVISGYLEHTRNVLTPTEKSFIYYSGAFMIYMQAIRFLTDHLNNDAYYGARYDDHNFVRARNQFALLDKYTEQKDILESIIEKYR